MTRRRKGEEVGYDFVPFPTSLHPLWTSVTMHKLGLCLRLFMLTNGKPYRLYGADWRGWLCHQLVLKGDDRKNVRKTLKHLFEIGLIRIECDDLGKLIVIGFFPDFVATAQVDTWSEDAPKAVANGAEVAPELTQDCASIDPALDQDCSKVALVGGVQPNPTPQNDLTLEIQREESRSDQIREEERERPALRAVPPPPSLPRYDRDAAYQSRVGIPDPVQEAAHRRERDRRWAERATAKRFNKQNLSPDGLSASIAWEQVCLHFHDPRGEEFAGHHDALGVLARRCVDEHRRRSIDVQILDILRCALFDFHRRLKESGKDPEYRFLVRSNEFTKSLASGLENNPQEFRPAYAPVFSEAGQ